jgi:hypothetical protein
MQPAPAPKPDRLGLPARDGAGRLAAIAPRYVDAHAPAPRPQLVEVGA